MENLKQNSLTYSGNWSASTIGGHLTINPDGTGTVKWVCEQTTTCSATFKLTGQSNDLARGHIVSGEQLPFVPGISITLRGVPNSEHLDFEPANAANAHACLRATDPWCRPSGYQQVPSTPPAAPKAVAA